MRFGALEIVLICSFALLIFGTKRIEQIGKSFKKATKEYTESIDESK